MIGKGKTWSHGTNSRLPFAFNVKLTGLRSSYGKISSPLTEISGTEQPALSYEHVEIFLQRI